MQTNTTFLGTKAETALRLFISTIFFGQKRKLLVESLKRFSANSKTSLRLFTGILMMAAGLVSINAVGQENVTNTSSNNTYTTIQAAIDDATAEDVISIQAGYVHDGILVTIPKNLTIQGNEVSINAGFNITSGSDVTINNLKIESIASPQGFYAFNTSEGTTISQVSDNSKLTMDGVTISHTMTTGGIKKNLVGFNLTVGGPTLNLNNSTLNLTNESIVYGIYAQSGGPTISVTNTTFNVAITPAALTNRSMNLIGHQFASDNTLANISLSGNTYNTTFSNPTEQKFFEVLLHARPTALSNTQINSYLNGVLTTGQTARVWYSDSQNAGNSNWNVFPGPVHNITSDVYYNTIQAAIDAVETLDGHVISVDAGTYEEGELLVNKELTLHGANVGKEGDDNTRGAESIVTDSYMDIRADNVVIDGFKFTGTPPNANNHAAQIGNDNSVYKPSHGVIKNNFLNEVASHGIYFKAVDDWIIEKNLFQGIGQTDGTLGSSDYSAMKYTGAKNVTVKDNVVHTVDYNGILLNGSNHNFTVTENSFTDIGKSGLQVSGVAGNVNVTANTFTNANIADDFDRGAIRIYGQDFDGPINISGNQITGGVAAFAVKSGNDITGKDIHFNNNSITGSTSGTAIRHMGTGTLDATCNWYGTTDATVISTGIDGDAHYIPFLVNGDLNNPDCSGTGPVVVYEGTTTNVRSTHFTIQAAIDEPSTINGDVIQLSASDYYEEFSITKGVHLKGMGQGVTTIYPTQSNPGPETGGTLNGNTIVFIEADGVEISELTVDGDNPNLTGGYDINGANVNARNGIVSNYPTGTYSSLHMHDVTVQNIFLRGVYMTYGGSSSNVSDNNLFENNTINNIDSVQVNSCGICMYGGSGIIKNNTFNTASTFSQYSKGVLFENNIINGGKYAGIRSENNGEFPGTSTVDIIRNNTLDNTAFGIRVVDPEDMQVVVENNTINNSGYGVIAGGSSATGSTLVKNNIIDAGNKSGSIGLYVENWPGSATVYFEGNTVNQVDTGLYIDNRTAGENSEVFMDEDEFSNVNDFYISMNNDGNGTIFDIDAQTVTFDGEVIQASNQSAIEAKVHHKVDDPNLGLVIPLGSCVQPNVVNTTTGLQYCTIQEAIDDPNTVNGNIIEVAAGTYPENVVVNKELDIRGPNYGIDPNTGTRVAEAIITPDPSVNLVNPEGDASIIVTVEADNVKINGFRVTGDNGTGPNYAGVNIQAGSGIVGLNNGMEVRNNIVDHFSYMGIRSARSNVETGNNGGLTSVVVANNRVENIHDIRSLGFGYGLYIQGTQADVTDNVVLNSRNGIQVQPYSASGSGTVLNNSVEIYTSGIYYNYAKAGSGAWTIESNNVTGINPPAGGGTLRWSGVLVRTTRLNGGPGTFQMNTIDGGDVSNNIATYQDDVVGYRVAQNYDPNLTTDVNTFTNNAISNVKTFIYSEAHIPLNATCNWYGTTDIAVIEAGIDGDADYIPFLVNGDLNNPNCSGILPIANLTQGTFYMTIQAAVDAADASDVLEIQVADFTEPTQQVVIDKDLTLQGLGKTATTLRPGVNTGGAGDARGFILVNPNVDFTFQDLTLDGSGLQISQGVRYLGGGMIDNVRFTEIKWPSYGGVGVSAAGTGNVNVSSSEFDQMGRIGMHYYGTGIDGATFTGNTYTGKGEGDWIDNGVEVGAGAKAIVSGNTITGNRGVASSDGSGSAGILVTTYFGAGTEADITGNLISDNSTGVGVGFDANDASVANIHENSLIGNEYSIISRAPQVNATCNWYGTTDMTDVEQGIAGPVTYLPMLMDDTESNPGPTGFDPAGDCALLPAYASFILTPSDTNVASCDEFTVEVKIETSAPIETVVLALEFDPTKLESLGYGSLASPYTPSIFQFDNTNGRIEYTSSAMGTNVGAGTHDIVLLKFKVIGSSGSTTIEHDLTGNFPSQLIAIVPDFDPQTPQNVLLNAENVTVNLTPDVTSPVITLLGDAVVELCIGQSYTDAGVTATDNCDGDVTATVITANPVDVNVAGTYTITYNVTDLTGNAATEIIRTVVVRPEPDVDIAFNNQVAGYNSEFEYCYNEEVTVTLAGIQQGDAPFTISWEVAEDASLDGTTSGLELGNELFSAVLDPGNYTISITAIEDVNGCEIIDLTGWGATVVVNEQPDVNVVFNGTIAGYGDTFTYCYNDNIVVTLGALSGTAPYNVEWTVDGTPDSGTLNDGDELFNSTLAAGIYAVQLTSVVDANGCELADSAPYGATVVVNEQPDVDVVFNGTIAGYGDTFTYCYNNNIVVTLGALSGTAPYNVEWTVDGTPDSGTFNDGDELFNSTLAAGTYAVQLTSVVDANGCELADPAAYGATVVVYEELVLTCPADISVNNEAGSCEAEVTFDALYSGGDPSSTITYSVGGNPISSPYYFTAGSTTVDVELVNDCGTINCSFEVEVIDNENPNITCATPATSYDADAGVCDYTVTGTDLDPVATGDNCSVASVVNDFNNAASLQNEAFPVGTTTVIWTITDGSGNTETCEYDVVVLDNESPTIACAQSDARFVDQPNNTYEVVGTEFDPTAVSDNCTAEGDIAVTHNAATLPGVINAGGDNSSLDGWQFPEGQTTVTFTATDAASTPNAATCTVVIDVEPQTLSGTVVLNPACDDAPVRIRFYNPNSTSLEAEYFATVVNGQFEIELAGLAPGNYDIFVKVERYLQKEFTNENVTGTGTSVAVTNLKIGDIAGNPDNFNDNGINGMDFSLVLFHYNSLQGGVGDYNTRTDLNCDGKVDGLDLSLVSFNFNAIGANP